MLASPRTVSRPASVRLRRWPARSAPTVTSPSTNRAGTAAGMRAALVVAPMRRSADLPAGAVTDTWPPTVTVPPRVVPVVLTSSAVPDSALMAANTRPWKSTLPGFVGSTWARGWGEGVAAAGSLWVGMPSPCSQTKAAARLEFCLVPPLPVTLLGSGLFDPSDLGGLGAAPAASSQASQQAGRQAHARGLRGSRRGARAAGARRRHARRAGPGHGTSQLFSIHIHRDHHHRTKVDGGLEEQRPAANLQRAADGREEGAGHQRWEGVQGSPPAVHRVTGRAPQ